MKKEQVKIWGDLTNDYYEPKDCPPHESEITLSLEEFELFIWKRLEKLGVKFAQCKKCGKNIFFLPSRAGKQMPVTCGLISHFADCKFAKDFRRKET